MLKKPATIALGIGVLLFSIIYFGLDTKPNKQKAQEKSRASNIEATGIQNIVSAAKDSLSKDQLAYLEALNMEVKSSQNDSLRAIALKKLSSGWYEQGYPILSGFYAEEVAKIQNDHDSWSVAGTTYILGMRQAPSQNQMSFSRNRAIKALESAISLEPDNVSDQINLSLIYVDAPDENPMQGILMLRDLNDKYPKNVSVMNQLARLAIRTNQVDKALERLSRAYELEPNNRNTICLLSKAYELAGDEKNTLDFKTKCENILKQ